MPNPVGLCARIFGQALLGCLARNFARRLGLDNADMRTCTYVSLNNEVTVKDLAEAFDRALATQGGLDPDAPFDAMVHSTGMLVVRSWLAADPLRAKRLKRLIALAPATFGSPLAKKGRSWLGSVFKGNKQLGPDFLEAGDRILDNLELASAFSWRLAEEDVFTAPPRYDGGPRRLMSSCSAAPARIGVCASSSTSPARTGPCDAPAAA